MSALRSAAQKMRACRTLEEFQAAYMDITSYGPEADTEERRQFRQRYLADIERVYNLHIERGRTPAEALRRMVDSLVRQATPFKIVNGQHR